MQVRVNKSADYSYIPRQGFAALPWNQCESVRPLAVDSDKTDRLLAYGNACCSGYSTGNDVIDGLMPGYFTRGLLIIIIIIVTARRYMLTRYSLPSCVRLYVTTHKPVL